MNGSRTTNTTNDQVIYTGRCRLYGIYPELTTTGVVDVYDGVSSSGTLKVKNAIGLTQQGKTFGPKGIVMQTGITIDKSVGTDICMVVWEPF